MRIEAPVLSPRDGGLRYACRVRNRQGERTLWFEVDHEFADMVVKSSEPALLALLIPAMHAGQDIDIEGRVCAELLWKIEHGYQDLLLAAFPRLRRVEVHVSDPVTRPDPGGRGVAAAFSGGVDSFDTLIEFTSPGCLERYRLTHLTYHLVGKPEKQELLRAVYGSLEPVAAAVGLPFVKIESNVGEFYEAVLRMALTHTTRDAATGYLLGHGLGVFLYSSGVHFSNVKLRKGMAYFDSIALPFLSSRALEMVSAGGHLTRVQKTLRVSRFEPARKHLNVCLLQNGQARNCSRCFKCLRTILCLEIAGELDQFAEVFDLEIYGRERERYLKHVARDRQDVHLAELQEFAREKEFPLARKPLLRRLRDRLEQVGH